MAVEVIVRTYSGNNQTQAATLFGEDAPRLAAEGWAPVAEVWVADEWSTSAYVAAALLVIVGIGIVLLLLFAFVKPKRTLMVTYQRAPDR